MAIITSIHTEHLNLNIDTPWNMPTNRITLLTGPNGSGKTQLLSSTARYLISTNSLKNNSQLTNVTFTGQLSSVISQTFSPFSRFPSAKRGAQVSSFLSRHDHEFYTCIGISQTKTYTARTLTRHTLEDALYRLAESENIIFNLFNIIRNLGYRENFRLKYKGREDLNHFRRIIKTQGVSEFEREIRKLGYGHPGSTRSKLSPSPDYDLLASAIEISERFQLSSNNYELDFNLYEKNINDFAAFQSFALLRRLGLLRLEGFLLFDERNPMPMDVTQTSSGQQQMLCSMLSLASALKDNSIVLIDEPELSLHPTWQYLYIDSLYAVLKQFQGCHILIATHSPLIVQQGAKNGADIIQLQNKFHQNILSDDLHIKNHISVESTLLNVFETPVTDSTHLANEILSAVVSAEADPSNVANALHTLQNLLKIYSNPIADDRKSIELIKHAIDCLS